MRATVPPYLREITEENKVRKGSTFGPANLAIQLVCKQLFQDPELILNGIVDDVTERNINLLRSIYPTLPQGTNEADPALVDQLLTNGIDVEALIVAFNNMGHISASSCLVKKTPKQGVVSNQAWAG